MRNHLQFERKLVFGNDDFPLNVSTLENHPNYPLHVHDFSEIVIVLGGSGVKIINDNSFPLSAGDVFVLHGNRPHGFSDTDQLSLINVLFDRSLLNVDQLDIARLPGYQALFEVEPALMEVGRFNRHLQLDFSQLTRVRALTNAMEIELHSSPGTHKSHEYGNREKSGLDIHPIDQGSRLIALGHFMVLVGTLSRWYAGKPIQDPNKTHKIGKVLSHLENHFEQAFDIEKLTAVSGMSRRNFYRAFTELTGKTPMAYLLDLRIGRAAHILQTTSKNITETAFECGFEDSNYFSRQFRKIMGITPSAYKAQQAPSGTR